jgi:hypothetical protein
MSLNAGKAKVGDLSAVKRFAAQFAACRANEFKGMETIATTVRIGSPGEPAAYEADGRVNSIQETTHHILHKHEKQDAK